MTATCLWLNALAPVPVSVRACHQAAVTTAIHLLVLPRLATLVSRQQTHQLQTFLWRSHAYLAGPTKTQLDCKRLMLRADSVAVS